MSVADAPVGLQYRAITSQSVDASGSTSCHESTTDNPAAPITVGLAGVCYELGPAIGVIPTISAKLVQQDTHWVVDIDFSGTAAGVAFSKYAATHSGDTVILLVGLKFRTTITFAGSTGTTVQIAQSGAYADALALYQGLTTAS